MTESKIPSPPADVLAATSEAYVRTPETDPWAPWSDEELETLRPLWEWGYRRGVEASCGWIRESDILLPGTCAEGLRRALLPLDPAAVKAQAIALLSRQIGGNHVKMIDDRERELLLSALDLIPAKED